MPTNAVNPSTKIAEVAEEKDVGAPQVSVTEGGVPANVQPVTVWPLNREKKTLVPDAEIPKREEVLGAVPENVTSAQFERVTGEPPTEHADIVPLP